MGLFRQTEPLIAFYQTSPLAWESPWPDHRPADAQQRQPALNRTIECARHFRHHVGKARLERGGRRAGIVGRGPGHDRAFLAHRLIGYPWRALGRTIDVEARTIR